VLGANCPVILPSRSDSDENKFYSIVAGCCLHRRCSVMGFQILTINPGSTSTKVAWFDDDKFGLEGFSGARCCNAVTVS